MTDDMIYTVAEITEHIAHTLQSDPHLQHVWLGGEVAQFTQPRSGHVYFSLKDAAAQISCVMWAREARHQQWWPEMGDEIRVFGSINVYRARGQYQFQAVHWMPVGRGSLYARFEQLRARLAQEGLFDPDRKRPVPAFPSRIGIVTSAEADALRDVLRTLQTRWPGTEVVLFPSRVQGAEAPAELVRALDWAAQYHAGIQPLDVLLLVRGGGSLEDLWAFNDERVVYALVAHPVPVIAGVGHETDFTLVDFAADVRASTPTGAAVAAVPDRSEILQTLHSLDTRLQRQIRTLLQGQYSRMEQLAMRLRHVHPLQTLHQRIQDMDGLETRLQQAWHQRSRQWQADLDTAAARLESLSPLAVLARGYSVVRRADGEVVTDPQQASAGETLQVYSQGGIYAVARLLEDRAPAPEIRSRTQPERGRGTGR